MTDLKPEDLVYAKPNGRRDVTPEREAAARERAIARGHRDTDHIIRTTEGGVPVWRFYV